LTEDQSIQSCELMDSSRRKIPFVTIICSGIAFAACKMMLFCKSLVHVGLWTGPPSADPLHTIGSLDHTRASLSLVCNFYLSILHLTDVSILILKLGLSHESHQSHSIAALVFLFTLFQQMSTWSSASVLGRGRAWVSGHGLGFTFISFSTSHRQCEPTFLGSSSSPVTTPNSCMQQYPKALSIPNFFRQPPKNQVA
jgi:hypothetical protein